MALSEIALIVTAKDQASSVLSKVSGSLGNVGMIAGGAVVAGLGAMTAAMGAGLSQAMDTAGAMAEFSGQTGIAGEELEEYKDLANELYTAGLGETIDDVAGAMAQVKTITGASTEELEGLTKGAMALSKVFDKDVQESTRAVDTAMLNFGADGEHVFDLITASIQRTGDPADDLLDTVNEYSTDFADAGFDIDAMFNTLISGSEAGVFNLDKVGDSVREFSTRIMDGSQTSRDALGALGIDADQLYSDFAAGNLTVADSLGMVVEGLQGMEDPIAQDAAGVGLFGSLWEDLGSDAIFSLAGMGEGLGNVEGATQTAADAMSGGLGAAWERLKRTGMSLLGEAMTPFLNVLTDLANEYLPIVQEWISEKVGPAIQQMGEWLSKNMVPALQAAARWIGDNVVPALKMLWEWMKDVADMIRKTLGPILDWLGNLWDQITGQIKGSTSEDFTFVKNFISDALDFIKNLIDTVLTWIRNFWEEHGQQIMTIVSTVFDTIKTVIETVLGVIWNIIKAIMAAISGDWEGAWEYIKNAAEILWEGIKTIITNFITIIQTELEIVLDYLQELWETVWTAVKDFAEGLWDGLKTYLTGLWDDIKSAAEIVWDLIKGFIKNPMTALDTAIRNIWGDDNSGIKGFLNGIWNGIKTAAETVWATITGIVEGAFDGVENAWNTAMSGVVDIIKNILNGVIGGFEGVVNIAIQGLNWLIEQANKIPGVDIEPIPPISLPRLHYGGLVGDEMLAYLRPGEAVIPLDSGRGINVLAAALRAALGDSARGLVIQGDLVLNASDPEGREFIDQLVEALAVT